MEEEEEAIRYYFRRSYDYNAILEFLDKYHDIRIVANNGRFTDIEQFLEHHYIIYPIKC